MSNEEDRGEAHSLRVKIGVLVGAVVAVSLLVSSMTTLLGVPTLVVVPATILTAVAVTQVLAHRLTSPLAEMLSLIHI